MRANRNRTWVVLLCAVLVTGLLGEAQGQAGPPSASVGQEAASAVLKHYDMNPTAKEPVTGQPLALTGNWYLGKTTPASCPQTKETCVEVFYDVPTQSVKCSWVVLLNADGSDGTFLDENENAARYLLRKVSKSEAKDLVVTRSKPVYPAIAAAARVSGVVTVRGQVNKSGGMEGLRILNGPAMLQQTSLEAANKWKFKPLMVGAVAVPYAMELNFTFKVLDINWNTVEMAP